MSEPVDWSGAAPRSSRFDDIYYSPEDGLEETRLVFLQGCGLPQAWLGRRRFTVGELGFGVGLNVLALIELWSRSRPHPSARLHIFSVEAFPVTPEDAGRALSRWPELEALAAPLLAQWPGRRRGFHRAHFEDAGVILDVAVMDVEEALQAWGGRADAWFLDGFAPSKNPEMWTAAVMRGLAARSAPGAAAATFSVAGSVRNALSEAGFTVTREPGFGRKAQRLTARHGGAGGRSQGEVSAFDEQGQAPGKILVIGAGVAGGAVARALRRLGAEAELLDEAGPGAGASGHPAALVSPRLDAGLGPVARLYAEAFARAVSVYRRECPEALIARGAMRLATAPRDKARHEAVSQWSGFEPGTLIPILAAEAGARLEEAPGPDALLLEDALVIEPLRALEAFGAAAGAVRAGRVIRMEASADGWRLALRSGEILMADAVVLAGGAQTRALYPGAAIRPVRGQISLARIGEPGAAASWGGYAVPTRDGVLFGATHDRDDEGVDVRAEDHRRNLQDLARGRPELARRLAGANLEGRAALRASTRDHLPLVGRLEAAAPLFLLAGLGGRGFTLAPLLAEALAAELVGAPAPLARDLWAAVSPSRPSAWAKARPSGAVRF